LHQIEADLYFEPIFWFVPQNATENPKACYRKLHFFATENREL